jgi:Rrf2 family transcriptional regulator, nitric oxide-sensitive transcriptional repressor
MISQTAQYALRAIVCLAARPHVSLTTAQLAEMTMVPSKYLSKVMQALAREDLVTSRPGKTGGFLLKASPDSLSLQRVIEAIDPPSQAERYPLDIQGYGNPLRPLNQRLSRLNAMLREECAKIYIKDLL